MADRVQEEADLVARLRRREPQAFTEFFEAHADRVYRLALGMLGNIDDAEEVAQATFISAMGAIDRFEPRGKLDTWLYRIAHNHALELARKRRPVEVIPDDDALNMPRTLIDLRELPDERLLSHEAHEQLWTEISRLPQGLRAAFTLRDVEGLSTADCAHVQEISEAACKVRLHRARLLLRERLSEYFAEWSHSAGAPDGRNE